VHSGLLRGNELLPHVMSAKEPEPDAMTAGLASDALGLEGVKDVQLPKH
jgi:hypothetical protein